MDWLRKGAEKVASLATAADPFVGREVEIATKTIRIRKVLAEGGFGIVYCGKDVANGEEFAVKRLRVSEKDQLAMVEKEVNCLTRLSSTPNKNIIRLFGVMQTGPSRGEPADIQILTEYCPGGTLTDLVKARDLSSAEVVVLQAQCCAAVAHLHSLQPSIIHRDIKLENFLLSALGEVKLCDFGSVTDKSVMPGEMTFAQIQAAEEDMELNTTPQNRSPEMLDMHSGKVVGKAGDVWALGCGLFKLCFREHPFEDAAKLGIINAKYRIPPNSKHPNLHPVITSMLNTNPDDRPSARGAGEMVMSAGVGGVDLVNPKAFVAHVGATPISHPASPTESPIPPSGDGMAPDSSGTSRARGFLGSFGSGAASMVSKARASAGSVVRTAVAKVTRGAEETNKHGGAAGDLDLTYICPRVIAAASPIDPVAFGAYLQAEHPQQCLLVDLSDEKRKLDPARFPAVRVEHIKWPLGQACALKRLFALCQSIHGWLLESSTNVVAVLCGNGKEDTGTVIASYLTYSRLCSSADAVRLFHLKRMAEGKRAITMSQQQYVGYIHRIVSGKPPHVRALHLGNIVLESIPLFNTRGTGCKPYLEIFQSGKLVKRVPDPAASLPYMNDHGMTATMKADVDVVGDVVIIAYHEYTMLGHSTSSEMFSLQFHTGFVDDKGFIRSGFEMEAPRKKPNKFDQAFGVRVECKIINKQLKKEMPWQVPGRICDANAGQKTCFTSQTEADQFLRDLENSRRSFTDSSSSSLAEGAESVKALSDDEGEMVDPVLLDFSGSAAAGGGGDSGGSHGMDAGRTKSGESNSSDLMDIFGATPPATNSGPPPAAQPLFTPTVPSQAPSQGGLDDIFGVPQSTTSVQQPTPPTTNLGGGLGDLLGSPQPTTNLSNGGSGIDLSGLFGAGSEPTPVAQQPSQNDLLGGLPMSGAAQSSEPSTPGTSVGQSDPFAAFGSSGSTTFNGFGQQAPAPASNPPPATNLLGGFGTLGAPAPAGNGRPKTPPSSQRQSADPFAFGGLGDLNFGSAQQAPATQNQFAAAATPPSATSTGIGAGVPPPTQNAQWSAPPTQSAPAPAATATATPTSRAKPTRTASMPQSSAFGPTSPKGKGGFFDFDIPGMPKEKPQERKTMGELKVDERLKTEDPDAIKVELWANGKKENIRAYLSTLQDILWEGAASKWKVVGLGQLMEASAVDKAYKKACRLVHPDKVKEDHPQCNLAHHIFIAITKGYQKWEDEGGKSM